MDIDLQDEETNERLFFSIFNEAVKLRSKKFKAYGTCYRDFGILGIMIKINDKCSRMKHLVHGGIDDYGETLYDSALDLANYAIMFAMEVKHGNKRDDGQDILKSM